MRQIVLMAEFDEPLANQIFSPVDVFGFGIFLIPSANSASKNVSLFALFLLILHGIRNTIACKSDTKKEQKSRNEGMYWRKDEENKN